jgi:DNA-binding IclR family transcriptional regulator
MHLAESRHPMMLRDVAAAARMPPAKAHRYLVSLARAGFIEQGRDTGLYDLGPHAVTLGLSALGRLQPVKAAQPFLQTLHEEISQTVAIAVWANRGATIVSWMGSDAPVSATLRVGSVMPLTRSATGQSFLAFLPPASTQELLRQELAQNKGPAAKSPKSLDALIKEIRSRGFARTSDFIPGISGCAMPVFDCHAQMVLAIVTLGYSGSIDLSDEGYIMQRMEGTARALSKRLGLQNAGR